MADFALCRRLLRSRYNDPGFDAFCHDRFPEVYDDFARGMNREEKITALLDHCRRNLEEYDRLVGVLGSEIDPAVLGQLSRSQGAPHYEVVMPHNFDLEGLVDKCLTELLTKEGLVGFSVPCHSDAFVKNFLERLKHELGRGRVRVKNTLLPGSFHTPVRMAVLTIDEKYRLATREGDVLFAVQCFGAEVLDQFWTDLCRRIGEQELQNRLIVIMTIDADCNPPESIISLDQPFFERGHLFRWARQLVEVLGRSEGPGMCDIRELAMQMETKCSHADILRIEWVYDFIDDVHGLLSESPTFDHIRHLFEDGG